MIDKLAIYILTYHGHHRRHLERCFWSIENQPTDVEYDIIVNFNSLKPEKVDLNTFVPEEYTLIRTESDGFTGKGTNSCLEHYLENYEANGWSHMCIIDGDDYYYPMALDLLNEIHEKSGYDYLSGMAHMVDSIRTHPADKGDPRSRIDTLYAKDRHIWSFSDMRLPVQPHLFWNGEKIPGGEVTLCMSTKAVKADIRALEGENRCDDYFFMLKAVAAHMRKEINFVSTDCNDIYVYDCTQASITRGVNDYDKDLGWPFDKKGLVLDELKREEYKVLNGITRQHLPYVTMPQIWGMKDKKRYVHGCEV